MQRNIQEITSYCVYFPPEYLGVSIILLERERERENKVNISNHNHTLEDKNFILIYKSE